MQLEILCFYLMNTSNLKILKFLRLSIDIYFNMRILNEWLRLFF
jgi:hypothetical protein